MSSATTPIAVLYCRVSSQKQVKNGHGLDSQEHRCREFTAYKGYEVGEVFRDEGVSGGMIDRPGMKAMLGWLRKRRGEALRVIFDDISRLARDFEAHKQLRAAIGSVGAVLESLSMMLLTVPVFYPIVAALGVDLIWFGIFVVVAIEISLITPPVGLNVFVLKAVVRDIGTGVIFRGVLPFVAMDIVRIILLILVPGLALWLPSTMG